MLPIRGDVPSEELCRLARLEADGRVRLPIARSRERARRHEPLSRRQRSWHGPADAPGLGDPVSTPRASWALCASVQPAAGCPRFLERRANGNVQGMGAARARPRARWRQNLRRPKDLCRTALDRFGVSYSENLMLDLLHGLGLSWQGRDRASAGEPQGPGAASKSSPGADGRDRAAASQALDPEGLVPRRGQGSARPGRTRRRWSREGHPPPRPTRPAPRGLLDRSAPSARTATHGAASASPRPSTAAT